jgi:hypothetical protein
MILLDIHQSNILKRIQNFYFIDLLEFAFLKVLT